MSYFGKNFSSMSEKYSAFCEEKNKCQKCSVFECYKKVVQSEGNGKNPTFMICAEAAGKWEIDLGRPLIGPAGQELRKHLREFKFNRSNTILTNVLPCRPQNNEFPKDWNVVASCLNTWLLREISILKPKIIVTCGAPALRAITKQVGVAKNRGTWVFVPNLQAYVFSTWHPSYVLRCRNDPEKQNVPIEFKNDLKRVAAEWTFVYSDEKLHLNEKEYNKVATEEIIEHHELQLSEEAIEW